MPKFKCPDYMVGKKSFFQPIKRPFVEYEINTCKKVGVYGLFLSIPPEGELCRIDFVVKIATGWGLILHYPPPNLSPFIFITSNSI